jgi:hypothetical protein
MLFVVMLMTALAAILICCADLSRIAELREHALERRANIRYFEDSARAISLSKYLEGDILPYSFTQTINGESVSITAEQEDGWMGQRSLRISWSATVKGQELSSMIHTGKATLPPPVYFGLWVGGTLTKTGADVTVNNGAMYLKSSPTVSGPGTFKIFGDAFLTSGSLPLGTNVTGTTYNDQPNLSVTLDSAKYDTAANLRFSGAQTKTGTTLLTSTGTNPLVYVDGNLTLSGSYAKNFTTFVKGNLTVQSLTTTGGAKAVLVVDGNVSIRGTINAYIICTGTVTGTGATDRTVNGALICNNLTASTYNWVVNWDNWFFSEAGRPGNMKIPGFW